MPLGNRRGDRCAQAGGSVAEVVQLNGVQGPQIRPSRLAEVEIQ